jgi:hypothetical protein
MIYQDTYGTVREIKKYGCYMCSLINAYLIQRAKQLHVVDVNEIYYQAFDDNSIDKNCFVNSALAFCLKTLKWSIRDVKKEPASYEPLKNEIEILLMRRYAPTLPEAEKDGYVYHFVLKSQHGNIYDPIYTGAVTTMNGDIHSKRIIVLNEVSLV